MSLVKDTLRKNKQQRVADSRDEIARIKKELKSRCRTLCKSGRLREALLYGSALDPDFFHRDSDIDIALGGVEPSDSWAVAGYLGRELGRRIDVQFIEDMPDRRVGKIREQGFSLL
jgi:predicted nucleotidyltransferase